MLGRRGRHRRRHGRPTGARLCLFRLRRRAARRRVPRADFGSASAPCSRSSRRRERCALPRRRGLSTCSGACCRRSRRRTSCERSRCITPTRSGSIWPSRWPPPSASCSTSRSCAYYRLVRTATIARSAGGFFSGILPSLALNVAARRRRRRHLPEGRARAGSRSRCRPCSRSRTWRICSSSRARRAQQYVSLSWGVLAGLMRSLDIRDQRAARHAAAVARFARDIAEQRRDDRAGAGAGAHGRAAARHRPLRAV